MGETLRDTAMNEIQILLAMGAIVALMLCLISSLFYQRWPSQSWRALVQFWLLVMGLQILLIILTANQTAPIEIPLNTQDPTAIYWAWGFVVLGIGYALSWQVEQRDRQQQQDTNPSGIPGGIPQPQAPYFPAYGPPSPPDLAKTGGRKKRGSRRGYQVRRNRSTKATKATKPKSSSLNATTPTAPSGIPGGIPQPNVPQPPSAPPQPRIMAVQWPLKPSAEALGMPQGQLPSRPTFGRAVASPKLMLRLHALTHSREVSERLICQNLKNNPGRSPDWAADKAISDLERDRR